MTAAGVAEPEVWAIAHRGASRDCPENTLPAFDEALRQGCDGIELDVQLSRDGIPVVYHDKTLARAGGGRRRVAQLDLDELRRLDAGSRAGDAFRGARIPTLEDVLSRYGARTRLLLEIKRRETRDAARRYDALLRAMRGWVRRPEVRRNVFVLCFDAAVLEAAAEIVPDLPRVLNLKPPRVLGRSLRRQLDTLHALSADVRTLTTGFGRAVRSTGRPLWTYTCNTPRRVARALEAGATAIMSDRPAWLVGRLERERDVE